MTHDNASYRSRRVLPFYFSNRFFVLFGCASAILLIGYLFHPAGLLVPATLNLAIIMLALADYVSAPSSRDIQIARLLFYPLAAEKPNEIFLEVRNGTEQSVLLWILDDVPERCLATGLPLKCRVKRREHIRVSYQLTPLKRGNAEFGDIHFWTSGRLGLVRKHGASTAQMPTKLYPGLALIDRHRLKGRPLSVHDSVRPVLRRGEGSDFDALREYVLGDDARLIHWSSSARRGKLLVRQNRTERGQTIFLVLDAGRMMTATSTQIPESSEKGIAAPPPARTKFDYALQAALLLAYTGLEAGDKIGITAVAGEVIRFLPPAKDRGQFGRILESTYALEPRMEEPRFHAAFSVISSRLKRRSLVVVFTDLIDERASQGLVRYCLGLRPRHLPLVAVMSDPEIVTVADGIPTDKRGLFRIGVAAEILERRGRLLTKLAASGVLVVDVPPDRISASVLDRYLDIKRRNVL